MKNKQLSVLGLCRKAGRLKYGFDSVKEALLKNEAELIVFSSDISEKTKERIKATALRQGTRTLSAPFDMSELAFALGLGKDTAIVAICDNGFAELFLSKTEEKQKSPS